MAAKAEEKQVLIMVRGIIAGLDEEDQVKIKKLAEELRKFVKDNGEHGQMALALIGAEFAAEEN